MNASVAAMDAYRRVGIETKVNSANPHKLIALLFEGALGAIAKAIHYCDAGDLRGRLQAIDKANSIVVEGLMAGVDRSKDAKGEVSANLVSLYQHISHLLLLSNVENSKDPLLEAKELLGELYGAWQAIGKVEA